MADRLTQLQDCFDQLATQMFASLRYIAEHHPRPPFPPSQAVLAAQQANKNEGAQVNGIHQPNGDGGAESAGQQAQNDERQPGEDSPEDFSAALLELAQDLVMKEQQIELIVRSLPGHSRGIAEQEAELERLNRELLDMDAHVEQAAREKEQLLNRVEQVIWKVNRY